MDIVFYEFEEILPVPHISSKTKTLPHSSEASVSREKKEQHLTKYRKIKKQNLKHHKDLNLIICIDYWLVTSHVNWYNIVLDKDYAQEVDDDLDYQKILSNILSLINQLICIIINIGFLFLTLMINK